MWSNPDLVTFTEEILNDKLQFLCRVKAKYFGNKYRWSLIYSPVSLRVMLQIYLIKVTIYLKLPNYGQGVGLVDSYLKETYYSRQKC